MLSQALAREAEQCREEQHRQYGAPEKRPRGAAVQHPVQCVEHRRRQKGAEHVGVFERAAGPAELRQEILKRRHQVEIPDQGGDGSDQRRGHIGRHDQSCVPRRVFGDEACDNEGGQDQVERDRDVLDRRRKGARPGRGHVASGNEAASQQQVNRQTARKSNEAGDWQGNHGAKQENVVGRRFHINDAAADDGDPKIDQHQSLEAGANLGGRPLERMRHIADLRL